MPRVLAIDYGSVRVGVAISDPSGFLARGLETIQRKGDDAVVIQRLQELIREYDVQTLVVGLPLRTDGREGERELRTRQFGAALAEASGLPLIYQDERYTSLMAAEIMQKSALKAKKRKQIIDQIAAEIILQDYLNAQN